jgi:hypothetical protein
MSRKAGLMELLVVCRGMSADYYKFLQVTAGANGTAFLIDRRGVERRREPGTPDADRRNSDRRSLPPDSWTRDAFVSVQYPER